MVIGELDCRLQTTHNNKKGLKHVAGSKLQVARNCREQETEGGIEVKKDNGTKNSNSDEKTASAGRRGTQRRELRIRAVRRSKPDVQRLAQALIEIAMSQGAVVVDEPDGEDESTKVPS